MSRSAEISRTNPTCIILALDQSTSMNDCFPGEESGRSKAQALADAANRLMQNLAVKATKGTDIRDYYDVGVFGYGASVGSALAGRPAGKIIVPVSEIAKNPLRIDTRTRKVDDGAGGLIETSVKMPIWIEATGDGGTPMVEGLELVHKELSGWLDQHQNCFPPVVINISDGEGNDGDPSATFEMIAKLSSTDGNVLIVNVHLSSNASAKTVMFPSDDTDLPDEHARMLFRHSSLLTPAMIAVAGEHEIRVGEGARAFVLNADPVALIQSLDVGTRPANIR